MCYTSWTMTRTRAPLLTLEPVDSHGYIPSLRYTFGHIWAIPALIPASIPVLEAIPAFIPKSVKAFFTWALGHSSFDSRVNSSFNSRIHSSLDSRVHSSSHSRVHSSSHSTVHSSFLYRNTFQLKIVLKCKLVHVGYVGLHLVWKSIITYICNIYGFIRFFLIINKSFRIRLNKWQV